MARKWRRCVIVLATIGLLVAGTGGQAGLAVARPGEYPVVPPPAADPFYTPGQALGPLAPGAVLRTRTVPYAAGTVPAPPTATQVLYRSTDQHGAPTSTVATILRPQAPGPVKLLSYHMAYDALGSQCDPSYTLTGAVKQSSAGSAEQLVINGYLAAGYTVVVPDYEGPNEEWTIGRQSAYLALDGIRATMRALRLPRSTPIALAGYSGGSVPTQWGAEVAPKYAPELNIVAAAAGGLPVYLAHNLPYVSGSKGWAGVIPAMVVAYQRTYGFDTDAFLSAKGKRLVKQVADECINAFAGKYPGLTDASMVAPPYTSLLQVAPMVRAMNDNIMGSAGTPRVPMLLAVGDLDGIGDSVMITRDVIALAYKYCTRGVPVTYAQYPRLSHGDAFFPFQAQTAQFLTQRFAGGGAPSNCGTFGRGNSLAPLPVP